MHMYFNMKIPGFEGVEIHKVENVEDRIALYVMMPRKEHKCPVCGNLTSKVHDYRIQKIKHLKWFERLSMIFYKRRRYVCDCGKRFSEDNPFVERYQQYSKEWNQVARIKAIKGKTFKETAEVLGTSITTIIRRFDSVLNDKLANGVELPKHIAIDEYKGDTDAGTYQLIIANAETHEPLDILPNRRKNTIKDYLRKFGSSVNVVVMDMNPHFKEAVKKALSRPVIVADRFHYSRYIYWALDEVRRIVQKEWHAYDRKQCKRMRHVLYKRKEKLKEKDRWYLNRYLGMSDVLKQAYILKEAYCKWLDWAKKTNDIKEIKEKLFEFYKQVEESNIPAFIKAIQTFKNWQVEILNSFSYGYSNGFLEGINNKSKVIKRNAYGFKRFEHYKGKILLSNQYKEIGVHLG
ncbi:ISL3 family transposase [Lysinibacillus sp. PLM2]|nr:ISL3 family transposase [Lysinibacillus sp. PLM2]BDH61435.1 ISL3 family transposase [Lysinibacillus sp. PLM2]BDH61601.1 ISL3 family transposase [Lysinibacillus sp. PLM2]BDH61724.1 ISL3 family transposase [Lysinibacillus sp. PLM2]BDH62061.1 ISL3 family transposase [Lysinibacillus sp. PLM2]